MPKRAHIVTMDEARAASQLSRQKSPESKQRFAAGILKRAGKGASPAGVRKLGQSPQAHSPAPAPTMAPGPLTAKPPLAASPAPRRSSRPLPLAELGLDPAPRRQRGSQPHPPRLSQPRALRDSRPQPRRGSQPFPMGEPEPWGRPRRDAGRFDEEAERAAERAQALGDRGADAPPAGADRPRRGLARLTARFGGARQAAAKNRAARTFERQYGGSDAPASEPAGPRAAVYEGRMGSSHRRATNSLNSGALGSRTASLRSPKRQSRFSARVLVPTVVAACLVVTCLFMYGPMQLWYQQMRENDRLQLEYAALQERNEALQGDVDALSSAEGVEDRVHQQYGWVRQGEHAVSVSGMNASKDIDFIANVSPGSVKPPETWYSAFLDPLFGVA